jgi:phenylalanyl-tRNA synthetase beta chain
MKISYSWIKELIDVKEAPEKLAEELSMAGLSVAALERVEDDWVFDIEVTSNRPDWLCVRGIVREIAAITGAKLRKAVDSRWSIVDRKSKAKKKNDHRRATMDCRRFSIAIENTKDCALYYGRLIRDVNVAASPQWIQKRLRVLGLRPINNIVDITNYCLWETGQPLHAFDADKLKGAGIAVRRARSGETITLLDASSKKLSDPVLVIADQKGPVALAGIMGGADTQVVASTRDIFLESAYFNPVTVRRGSRTLGIASDSSYRFERGVDSAMIKEALDRASDMICALAGGRVVATEKAGKIVSQKVSPITFDLSRVLSVLGLRISAGSAKSILRNLGFSVRAKSKDTFSITVPSWRRDVRIPEDVSEELVRVFGYDKIPLTVPAIKPFVLAAPPVQVLERRVRDIFSRVGLKEVITYSLISEDDFKKTLLDPGTNLRLENPLSQEYCILRDTLIPSLLSCAFFNLNHGNKDLEIFEVAHVFSGFAGLETVKAGIVLCGEKRSTWHRKGAPYDFFDLKGIVEVFCEELQVKNYSFRNCEDLAFAQKGMMCQIVAEGRVLGVLGQVGPAVKKAWGIKGKEDIFVAEIALEPLAASADLKKRSAPLVGVPSILRDVSVLADKNAAYDRIKALIETRAAGFVRCVALADTYQGKEVPEGFLGLTITIEYGVLDKTLTDAQVNSVHQKVLDSLGTELSLKIR